MLILALEVATRETSVALWENGETLVEIQPDPGSRTAGSLAPAIQAAMKEVKVAPANLDAVAVSVGPGSFTGLRIGITLAKTFSYSLQKPVMGIDSLTGLARQSGVREGLVTACLPAQRGDYFAATWKNQSGNWEPLLKSSLLSENAFVDTCREPQRIVGPGLAQLQSEVADRLRERGCQLQMEVGWPPRAAPLAEIAAERLAAGQLDDAFQLKPVYLRPSYAEE